MGLSELAACLCAESTALIRTCRCVPSSLRMSVCIVRLDTRTRWCVFVNVPPSVCSLYVCFLSQHFLRSGFAAPCSGNGRSRWLLSDSLLLSNIVSTRHFQLLLPWDPPSQAAGQSDILLTQQQISFSSAGLPFPFFELSPVSRFLMASHLCCKKCTSTHSPS